jgi:nucleoside-diphosphate-sugar epimerase
MLRTAFVTGGAGFLGRRLVRLLTARNIQVRCLIRETTPVQDLLDSLSDEQRARVQFVTGDVRDRALLEEEFHHVEVVYHLAAALGGSPSTLFLQTVIPTRTLLEVAAASPIRRCVLVSSLGVYGTQTLRRGGLLDESAPIDPHPEQRDPYSMSKIRQEAIAWEARERWGLPLVVVRPGVIYGPGRTLLTSRVGLSLGPLLIRLGGRNPLPYTYVDNCADALALAGMMPDLDGEIINVVDDDLPTGNQIVRTLRQAGKRIRSVQIPSRLIGPLSAVYEGYSHWSEGQLPPVLTRYRSDAIWKPLRYSNAKARRLLNWQPQVTTAEALQRTISG